MQPYTVVSFPHPNRPDTDTDIVVTMPDSDEIELIGVSNQPFDGNSSVWLCLFDPDDDERCSRHCIAADAVDSGEWWIDDPNRDYPTVLSALIAATRRNADMCHTPAERIAAYLRLSDVRTAIRRAVTR